MVTVLLEKTSSWRGDGEYALIYLKKDFDVNKHIIGGAIVVAVAIGGVYGYYHYSEVYPSTDNAYVDANLVNISPKIGGYIKNIYVENNQLVHKGDLLLTLDPQDYSLMLTKAQQDLILSKQQAISTKQQISAAQASVVKAQSDYNFAKQMAQRYTDLYQQKAGSEQDMQRYQNQANQAKQALDQANVALTQATTQYTAAVTQIDLAQTNVKNAQNNTNYTELRSPVDGYISNLNLQTGELVGQGQKLFGLVDNHTWWVNANFKETQIKRIQIGQPVIVELDMYDHKYSATVKSISYASGNTFSLLPAENATGNWVKVTQRFTIRVKLENDLKYPLRVGASSKITIDTSKE